MRIHAKSAVFGSALFAILAAGSVVVAQSQPSASPVPFGASAQPMPRLEKGFTRIFNGKDLEGWKQCGPGELKVLSDGSLLATGGMGMLWYAKEQYKDFVLKVDWKAREASSNSGVFVRLPDPGDDPWIAVNKGYEIQISDAGDGLHRTGAVYTFGPSSFTPKKPYGQWNTLEVKAIGTSYLVKVNGKVVTRYVGDRSLEGYIGVQNHHPDGHVAYRNIRIKKLNTK